MPGSERGVWSAVPLTGALLVAGAGGDHVHVHLCDRRRDRVLETIHYTWPDHEKEGC